MPTTPIVPPERGARLAIRGERRTGRSHALAVLGQARGGCPVVSITADRRLATVPLGAIRSHAPEIETPAEAATELRRVLGRDGLLLVDDAQWLDPDTVGAIVLVAPTVGLAYTTTGADALVTRNTDVVPLGALDAGAMSRLVEERLGGPVHRAFVDDVLRRSRGRAGVAVPLVDAALDAGSVDRRFGVWVGDIPPTDVLAADPSLAEIVALTELERSSLEHLAVGGPLPADALTALGGEPAALASLEAAGIVAGTVDALDVSIPLVRDLILGTTPSLRRSMIEQRLVEVLPDRFRHPSDAGSAALALRHGVQIEQDVVSGLVERALAVGRTDEAATLASHLPAGFARSMLHTNVALVSGRPDRALPHATEATDRADGEEELALAGMLEAQLIAMGGHDLDAGIRRLAELEDRIARESARGQLRAFAALLHTYAGRVEPALALPSDGGNVPAAVARSLALAVSGQPGADELIVSVREPDPVSQVLLEINRWFAALAGAELDRGLALLVELARHTVQSPVAGVVQANLAGAYTLRGDLDRARLCFAEALGTLNDSDPLATLQAAWAFRVLAGGMAREPDCAALADEFRAAVPDPMPFAAGFRSSAHGWVALATADPAGAVEAFDTATSEFASAGMHALAPLACHGALLAGGTVSVSDPRGALARIVADEAAATAADDAAALVNVGERYLRGGFVGWAADVFHRAAAATDDDRERSILGFRAAATLRAASGYVPPWLDDVEPVVSPRELEVACLAGAGWSSPEIAEAIHVSTRTVDNHLGRVYAKLRVDGRADLGPLVPSTLAG